MPVNVNFSNIKKLNLFVADNIVAINNGINEFKIAIKANPSCPFDDTDIKNYLKNKLVKEIKTKAKQLLSEFKAYGYRKDQIYLIANKYVYYKNDLEAYYEKVLFKEVFDNLPENIDSILTDKIKELSTSDQGIKNYVSSTLKNIVKKSLVLIGQNGFSNNINNIESGVQTANAGDSAQFLFISRAILAGFNCSNVDVRSSRYDAVIDYKGLIFKVQVKGISSNSVSFKDRDRGGRGIDTHNERNQGKRITSEDCDIYVAVDKQVGICYLIPMKDFVDKLTDDQIKSYSVNNLVEFRENWGIINEVYNSDPRSKYTAEKINELLKDLDKKVVKK